MASSLPQQLLSNVNSAVTNPRTQAAASSMLSYAGTFLTTIADKGKTYVAAQASPLAAGISDKYIDDSSIERDLDKLYHAKVRPLLDAVDKLRTILSSTDIKLPTIVVVGDQSSGKSSVLEALSGINLPRGSNITTRVPLVLRLVNSVSDNHNAAATAPYATISAARVPEERLSDLSQIGNRVVQLTNQLAGRGVGVVDKPISLTVYRPHSPDLTLVDLPGITRNPIGDQPKSIYTDIVTMIKRYIEPAESVILNVMPVNIDFATAECVMLSKQFDPPGKRTIAVVTKCDLAEAGVKMKLQTAVDQLGFSLGLVGVKNRNQVDNDSGVTWQDARQEEQNFFINHPELNTFVAPQNSARSRRNKHGNGEFVMQRILVGTSALAALLTTVQEQHVRLILPKKRIELRDLLSTTRMQYNALPSGVLNATDARIRLDQMINSFISAINALCNGDHSIVTCIQQLNANTNNHFNYETLHVNPRIHEHYIQYQKSLAQSVQHFLTTDFANKVAKEISENTGITLPNFLSHQVFKSLIHNEIVRLRQPTLDVAEAVRNTHATMLSTLTRHVFGSFPALSQTVGNQLLEYLEQRQNVVLERVDETLAMENDVFTMNPWYLDTVNKVRAAIDQKQYKPYSQHAPKQQSGSGSAAGFLGSWISDNNSNAAAKLNDKAVVAKVNDLPIMFDPSNYTLNSNNMDGQQLQNQSVVLDMQIACFVYMNIVHKRLVDQMALTLRYHYTRTMSTSGHPVTSSQSASSLVSVLQRQWIRASDSEMMEYFKEANDVREKREKLANTIKRLEEAGRVFEAIS